METPCVIYLARNCTSRLSAKAPDLILGRTFDPGLSDEGRQETNRLYDCLGSRQLTAIYTSPKLRALQTAYRLVHDEATAKIKLTLDLATPSFGAWEGKTWQEVQKLYPVEAEALTQSSKDYIYPGGESWTGLQTRMAKWVHTIAVRHPFGRILAVTHEEPLRAALAAICGSKHRDAREMTFKRGSFLVIRVYGQVPKLEAIWDPAECVEEPV